MYWDTHRRLRIANLSKRFAETVVSRLSWRYLTQYDGNGDDAKNKPREGGQFNFSLQYPEWYPLKGTHPHFYYCVQAARLRGSVSHEKLSILVKDA